MSARARAMGLQVVGVVLVAMGSFSWATRMFFSESGVAEEKCERWLESPQPGWVSLKGCLLDAQNAVLESSAGHFETLADRREGLSRHLPPEGAHWVAAWLPVTTETGSRRLRAVYRESSPEVVAWLGALEAGHGDARAPLHRLTRPAVVEGWAAPIEGISIREAFNVRGSSMLGIRPGGERPAKGSFGWLVWAGVCVSGLGYWLSRRNSRDSGQ